MMVTLRRADQVLTLPRIDSGPEPQAKELKLAERLVEEISGRFEPSAWQDEYHERVCRLIEAKAKGKKPKLERPRRRRASGGLSAQLRASLESMQERKVA
jgi:DNA end-binding protein Ku